MRRLLPALLLTVTAATACSTGTPGDITAAGQRVLAPQVQRVRDVAATGSYHQLQAEVARLKTLVETELRKGQVSETRARAIDDAADALLVDAAPTQSPSSTPSPTASSTPTTSTTPTQSPTQTPTQTPTSTLTPTQSESPSPVVSVSVP